MTSVVLCAGAVGIDFFNAATSESGQLFHNRAIDEDA
jgi:hypothetical protein